MWEVELEIDIENRIRNFITKIVRNVDYSANCSNVPNGFPLIPAGRVAVRF